MGSRYKARNVRHQVTNTRAREKIDANEKRVAAAADKYRAAWGAMQKLKGPGDWTTQWRELKQVDVRCLQDEDAATQGQSEGRRTLSWIWMSADDGGDGDNTSMNEGACHIAMIVVHILII